MEELSTKEQVSESMIAEYERLKAHVAGISPQEMARPGVVGEWAVKDILAHLTAWEQIFIGWYQAGLRGEKVELPVPGMTWAQMDELNREIFEEHCDDGFEKILADFDASHQQILEITKTMQEQGMFAPGHFPWTGEDTLAYYLRECSDIHYDWAIQMMEK